MANEMNPDFNKWMSQGAIYGSGDRLLVFWGDAAASSTCTNYPSVYSNDFFLKETKPWTHYSSWAEQHPILLETKVLPHLHWTTPDKERFAKDFSQAQLKLKSHELQKIVLATEARAPKTANPETFLGNALGSIPRHTHIYGQWNEREGFLGYTPEILFSTENLNSINTMALAGTSAVDVAETQLHTPKNKEEHNWVVDDIISALQPLGQVRQGKTETLSLRTLAHLYTPIDVRLAAPVSVDEIIRILHPTPALGVAPRSKWRELQELRSGYGRFGAPFVVAKSPQNAVGLVGIRQIAWDEKYYYIRCGCGVVKESQLEDEWQELLLKIQSVKTIFGWAPS